MKCFLSPYGDHETLINVYRASDDFLEKRKVGLGKEKVAKILRNWCKENFINSRSLTHARDVHRSTTYFPCCLYGLVWNISVFDLNFPNFYCFFSLLLAVKFEDMLNKWVYMLPLVGMTCLSFADVLLLHFFLNGAIKQPGGTYRYCIFCSVLKRFWSFLYPLIRIRGCVT